MTPQDQAASETSADPGSGPGLAKVPALCCVPFCAFALGSGRTEPPLSQMRLVIVTKGTDSSGGSSLPINVSSKVTWSCLTRKQSPDRCKMENPGGLQTALTATTDSTRHGDAPGDQRRAAASPRGLGAGTSAGGRRGVSHLFPPVIRASGRHPFEATQSGSWRPRQHIHDGSLLGHQTAEKEKAPKDCVWKYN